MHKSTNILTNSNDENLPFGIGTRSPSATDTPFTTPPHISTKPRESSFGLDVGGYWHKKNYTYGSLLAVSKELLLTFWPDLYPGDSEFNYSDETTTWGDLLQKYDDSNIYMITDSYEVFKQEYPPIDINKLEDDTVIVLTHCYYTIDNDFIFIGQPETSSVIGYIKTFQENDELLWMSLKDIR